MSIQVHDANRHEAAQLRAHFRQCAFALGPLAPREVHGRSARCIPGAAIRQRTHRHGDGGRRRCLVVGLIAFHEQRTSPACA